MTITAIQDALDALINTTLPAYVRLSDATDVADNPNIYLNRGFATAIGSASREQRELCNGMYVNRIFTVILTNTYNASLNAEARKDLEQALAADQTSLMLAIETNRSLNGTCINAIYDNDNGIEYIVDQQYQKQYIGIVSDISIQYIERV